MFELQWPWLLALIPLPFLVKYLWKPAKQSEDIALRLPFYAEIMNAYKSEGYVQPRKNTVPQWVLWLIWGALVFAIARPMWVDEPIQIEESGRELMLAVDLSGSMEINDMTLHGQPQDRLSVAKSVVTQFIQRRVGDRIGLILFGTKAYLQAPLTFDRKTVTILLNEAYLGMAGNKTSIGDALGLAVKHLRERPEQSRAVILLTDGANTSGQISPLQATSVAQKHKIRIYTIGMGADEMVQPGLFGSNFGARTVNPSADLDEKTLEEIARTTGGKYFRARNTEELNNIYALLDQLEPVVQDQAIFRPTIELYYWPLAIALILCLLSTAWRFPWFGKKHIIEVISRVF